MEERIHVYDAIFHDRDELAEMLRGRGIDPDLPYEHRYDALRQEHIYTQARVS